MAPKPIQQLTGIRAIAAIAVVFFHFDGDLSTLLPILKYLNRVIGSGHLGVDVFFVLSGFILTYNYLGTVWSPREYRRFLWLRLARIYPVHLFTLLLLVPVVLREHFLHIKIASEIDTSLRAWFANVGLLQGWPLLVHNTSWNFPAWSISDEWFAYLLFPLGTAWLNRKKLGTVTLWLLFVACFALLLLCYVVIPDPDNPIQTGPARILCEFSAGVILYEIFAARQRFRISPLLLATLGTIVAALLVSHLRLQMFAVPVFALMILELANEGNWLTRILSHPWCVYGGEASYSLYMTHAFAQIVLRKFLPSAHYAGTSLWIRSGVVTMYALVICVFAIATFEFVEKPCRRYMRTVIKPDLRAELPKVTSQSQPA